jgi:hypothetical protein
MVAKSRARRQRSTSLDRLAAFEDDCLLVVIETPKGSPNKLAFDRYRVEQISPAPIPG